MAGDQPTTTNDQKRPALATAASVLHVLMGLSCVALVVYLLYLTRTKEILSDKDAAETVHGLRLAAVIFAPVAVAYLAGGIGLWKGRLWGWLISAVADVLWLGFMLWDAFSEAPRYIDWDEVTIAAAFLILLVFVLLPHVRRWCWQRARAAQAAA